MLTLATKFAPVRPAFETARSAGIRAAEFWLDAKLLMESDGIAELALEFAHLLTSLLAFAVLTAASAGSFNAQVKSRSWRGWAHAATLACLALVVAIYWPWSK